MGRGWRFLVPLVAAVAGLLFATSAATARGTDLRAGRSDRLADLILRENAQVARLADRAEQLRREVLAATGGDAGADGRVEQARRSLAPLESIAGLDPLSGPGLTVALDDAPRRPQGAPPPRGASPDDLVVHQQDVQAVVNALWAGGAQGLALMDQRVIATSAVRCVGNTLILQGVVYSPPYVVTAVGDPQRLRAALAAAPGVQIFEQYVDAYGLRFDVTTHRFVTLPRFAGTLALRYARVATS